jgi:succinate dehydrogenase / fumarate reductase cytochrome b subunit
MRGLSTLYRSSVGKKAAMAASGILLLAFVVLHMLGNLKAFQGRESFDAYAAFLREVGYPIVPHEGALWGMRAILLVALTVHVIAAVQLWGQSRNARGRAYEQSHSQVFSYASRTMRWGGAILLAFIVYHLLHLTTGTVHPDFEHGSAYDNLVIGLSSAPVAGFYLLAVGMLSAHLYHGVWSVFATLGVENARVSRLRRPLAAAFAVGLFVGYAVVPVAIFTGILTLGTR